MAKPNPPRIRAEDIPTRPDGELEQILERMYFRNLNNIDQVQEGHLNEAWGAFEALGMLFSLLDNGVPFEDAKASFPVPNWRKETVEVPVALVRQIVGGWHQYRTSPEKNWEKHSGLRP